MADRIVADGTSATAGVLTKASSVPSAPRAPTRGAPEPWAHGVVGVGVSMAEWWLERNPVGRDVVEEHLAAFIWHAFDGLSREHGLRVAKNVTQS